MTPLSGDNLGPQYNHRPIRSATKVSSVEPPVPPSLIACGIERQFPPGSVLFTAGSEPEGMYVILEGRVRVMRGTGGRAHVIHEETAGGTLGEVPMFSGGRFPATAVAADRTRCVIVTRAAIREALRDPAVAELLLARLASRVRLLVEQLDRRTGHGVMQRLATYILDRDTNADTWFTLGGTQQEIAESLGTVRELIVRNLRTLREAELIRSDGRGRYTIVDRDGLQRLARGD